MEKREMTNHEKHKMIDALNNLKKVAFQVADLWQAEDGSGVTPFDEILNQHYPFNDDFYFTLANIETWVDQSVYKLRLKKL